MAWLTGGIITLLLGTGLLVLGLHGRRVDNHPHCRRCGYDLDGLYPGSALCPECDCSLAMARSVRHGGRVRRRGFVTTAAVLLLISGLSLGLGVAKQASSPAFYAVLPDFLLVQSLHEKPARDEVLVRLRAGTLGGYSTGVAVDWALAMQGRPKEPWDPAYGEIIEEAWAAGLATPAQLDRYAGQASKPELLVRPSVQRGRETRMSFDYGVRRLGPKTKLTVELPIRGIEHNGRAWPQAVNVRTPTWSFSQNSGVVRSNMIGPVDADQPGEQHYKIDAEHRYTLGMPMLNVAPHVFSPGIVTHRATVSVIEGLSGSYAPAGPTDQQRGRDAYVWIEPDGRHADTAWVAFGTLLPGEPEAPAVGYKAWFRFRGEVYEAGAAIRATGSTGGRPIVRGTVVGANDWSADEPVNRIDILIRPDLDLEESWSSIRPVWAGQWIARDVPWSVEQPQRGRMFAGGQTSLVPIEAETLTPEEALRPVTAADFD